MSNWVATVGLFLDIAGAAILLWGVFISPRQAANLSVPHPHSRDWRKNLLNPQPQYRRRQARIGRFGLLILIVGFGFQIMAIWI